MCMWDYVIRHDILSIHYAISPNLPLWGVRRLSGLWFQQTPDGIKITWYKNKTVISRGNSVFFAFDQMLTCSFKSSRGIPLFCTLSILYSVLSCIFLIFLWIFFDQSSILPFLLIRNSCGKTVCGSLF